MNTAATRCGGCGDSSASSRSKSWPRPTTYSSRRSPGCSPRPGSPGCAAVPSWRSPRHRGRTTPGSGSRAPNASRCSAASARYWPWTRTRYGPCPARVRRPRRDLRHDLPAGPGPGEHPAHRDGAGAAARPPTVAPARANNLPAVRASLPPVPAGRSLPQRAHPAVTGSPTRAPKSSKAYWMAGSGRPSVVAARAAWPQPRSEPRPHRRDATPTPESQWQQGCGRDRWSDNPTASGVHHLQCFGVGAGVDGRGVGVEEIRRGRDGECADRARCGRAQQLARQALQGGDR